MLQEVKKMGFSTNWITLLLVAVCTLVAHGQENAQNRIPDSIIECYRNHSLRNPENRPPMNIQTFIDLVRKVEEYQRDTVDMAGLTTSILHRFRLDGIERSQDVVESEGVLPYAVKGDPFYKHRLILKYLVPTNNQLFPNESLSQVELCTLHFMLSHTIETTQRGDESTVCAKVANYESGSRAPRRRRIQRQALSDEESEETVPDLSKDAEEVPVDDTGKGFQGSAEDSENTSENVPKDTDVSDATQTQEEEEEAANQTVSGSGTKSGKYIFDDETPLHNFQQRARSVLDPQTDTGDTARVLVSTTESDCPLEGGAVYTVSGTVSLGAVIAGLAAGLYQEDVPTEDLIRKTPPLIKLPTDLEGTAVDNRFAATLVGDVAEAALQQGPKTPNAIKIGLTGGWNSTVFPRWYFENERDGRELTDAEIRGGLDGLVLGTKIRDWRDSLTDGDLKLSQLLSMYYSEDGVLSPQYRACLRRDLYSEVAPSEKMKEQAYRFAVALYYHSSGPASVINARINDFAITAVTQLTTYLAGMTEDKCPKSITPRETNSQSLSLYTNVTVVIDKSWPFADIKGLIYLLALELGLSSYGSRLTVLDGKNGAAFITDAMYSVDVDRNFTVSEFSTHEGGMDIPQTLEQVIQKSMEGLLQAESEQNLGGGRSTVVLFVPYTAVNLNNNDLQIAKDKVKHIREYLPDVKLLYLAPGNKDNYKELVNNPNTDIITFSSLTEDSDKIAAVKEVTERIKQVPLRLFNPTCGANWTSKNYVSADFEHSVKQTGKKYHRLHPNYFFGVASFKVTVVRSNSQDLTVCHSRNLDSLVNGTNQATCLNTQTGDITINLKNACEGKDHISQCQPLYILVRPMNTSNKIASCKQCDNPTNVRYTIRNEGLGCEAGVGHLLSNPQVIFLTAVILLTKYLIVAS